MIARVAHVEHEVLPGELHALVREVELIEALSPPYNTQRAAHRGTPYLVLRDGRDAALDEIAARRSAATSEWERSVLAEARSRLLRVRREHRPLDLELDRASLACVDEGHAIEVERLSASQRHVLARWLWRSSSISRV